MRGEHERLTEQVALLSRATSDPPRFLEALARGEPGPMARAIPWLASPTFGRPDPRQVRRAAGAALRMLGRRVVIYPRAESRARVGWSLESLLRRGPWLDASLAVLALQLGQTVQQGETIVAPEG